MGEGDDNDSVIRVIDSINATDTATINMQVSSVRTQPPGNYTFPINIRWHNTICDLGDIWLDNNLTIENDPWAEFDVDLNDTIYKGNETILLNGSVINRGNINITAAGLRAEIFDRHMNAFMPSVYMNCTIPPGNTILTINSDIYIGCEFNINDTLPAGDKKIEVLYIWDQTYTGEKEIYRTVSEILSFSIESSVYGMYLDSQAKDIATVQVPVIVVDRFGRTSIQYILVGTSID
ncbi:MAG: hypothetical protein U9O53_03340, partial [archaeon]|nr:hypothetical protein [archaeon]